MPSSSWVHIPLVVSLVRQIEPQSILDVGIGFGKWGQLFREYTDIWSASEDIPRYQRDNWKVKIDGIEGFEPYITAHHQYLYNDIHIGDVHEVLARLGKYDLVFMGDVIEHFEKESGKRLLRSLLAHTNRLLVVTTPANHVDQTAVFGNSLEVHKSDWTTEDFRAVGECLSTIIANEIHMCMWAPQGSVLPRIDLEVTPVRKPSRLIRLRRKVRRYLSA